MPAARPDQECGESARGHRGQTPFRRQDQGKTLPDPGRDGHHQGEGPEGRQDGGGPGRPYAGEGLPFRIGPDRKEMDRLGLQDCGAHDYLLYLRHGVRQDLLPGHRPLFRSPGRCEGICGGLHAHVPGGRFQGFHQAVRLQGGPGQRLRFRDRGETGHERGEGKAQERQGQGRFQRFRPAAVLLLRAR